MTDKSTRSEISGLPALSRSFMPSRRGSFVGNPPEPDVPTVLKWWDVSDVDYNDEHSLPRHHLQRGVHTARPSVRFLKTVNTEDLVTGEPVAMNAQQYCVLITDVPKLEKLLKRYGNLLCVVCLNYKKLHIQRNTL